MIFTHEQIKSITKALRLMSSEDFVPHRARYGICFNLEKITGIYSWNDSKEYDCAVRSWPKFSSNTAYPITDGDANPESFYWDCGDKWIGKQGELRRELASHMAQVFENFLTVPLDQTCHS